MQVSGAGYVLQRSLTEWGVPCELCAPSLIPRPPGEHRKTDRRDAIKIAQDFRDDRLALISIPTEADERVRDLVRCRETFQGEIVKSRHYILEFMRRRGFLFRAGTHWTVRHMNWIRQVLRPGTLAEEDHVVPAEYLALLEYKLQRRDDLDRRIEELALAPGEHSSVDRRRMGAIIKAGNSRVRHVLVQAAWCSRRRPAVGAALRKRQQGQAPAVIAHAWQCQHRLYKLYYRLAEKKPKHVAATAVAREMVGFLWAVLRDVDVAQLRHDLHEAACPEL